MEILKNNKLLLTKNKITMEERSIIISLDKAREWYNQGGELKEIALSAFTEKEITESALPNTWKEFCEMYPIEEDKKEYFIDENSNIKLLKKGIRHNTIHRNVLPSLQSLKAHIAQMQLEQLRDCYRQGWKPDWSDSHHQCKWCIMFDTDTFKVTSGIYCSRFLSFQSKEIAEKFLNNFKYLIETAGDLI